MKSTLLTILLLICGFSAQAQNLQSAIDRELEPVLADAVDAYHEGNFGTAATAFAQAYAEDPLPAIAHNAALSYGKTGEVGLAALYLERAIQADPRNLSYRKKLSFLRNQTGLSSSFDNPFIYASQFFAANTLILLVTIAFWSTLSFFLLRATIIHSGKRRVFLSFAWFSLFLMILVALLLGTQMRYRPHAVVTTKEPLTSHFAPTTAAPVSGTLQPGERLWVKELYGDYVKVKSENNIEGWLPQARVSLISVD